MSAPAERMNFVDETALYWDAYSEGLRPDPPLWVDEWSASNMRIPGAAGSEPGPYRVERTPFAREIMQVLSPESHIRRVVCRMASQLTKTQVGLNWISAVIDKAPANILVLLPTLNTSRRVSNRIAKTIEVVKPLREKVAKPRSRSARNTIDTKEFDGGTLYITTAGSAANLAEVPIRYLYCDEINRWTPTVGGEGDTLAIARKRCSTFGRRAKEYYTSSPTLEDVSRIDDLLSQSDQRYYFVPCPHCGHKQALDWEHMQWAKDYSWAKYACVDCGTLIDERKKTVMLASEDWRASAKGDGETAGFTLSALYAPIGWVTWLELAKEYDQAKVAQDRGDQSLMQVFFNTRLALPWNDGDARPEPSMLMGRAEGYSLRTVPMGGLVLTAAVDVQGNRLEMKTVAWGEGMECWVVDYQILAGTPTDKGTWDALDQILLQGLRHEGGQMMHICATTVDSGGHHTQETYDFTRRRRHRGVIAIKGANRPGRPVISSRPTKVDVRPTGRIIKSGAELWMIGTDTAKEWIYSRFGVATGPGAMHFSRDLPADYYKQLTAERKSARYVKGRIITDWVKANADRNEALDLSVYNLAAAHFKGLHRHQPADWQRLRDQLIPEAREIVTQDELAAHTPPPPPSPSLPKAGISLWSELTR